MMYYVWTNWKDKNRRLRVAGSDSFREAMYYAGQYTEEGDVTVKLGNKILSTLMCDDVDLLSMTVISCDAISIMENEK